MSRGRITIMALSVMGLFAVRHFETDLFYDPLKPFFNGAYKLEDLPEINTAKWVLSLMGRYFLNSILALLLLHAIFRKKNYCSVFRNTARHIAGDFIANANLTATCIRSWGLSRFVLCASLFNSPFAVVVVVNPEFLHY